MLLPPFLTPFQLQTLSSKQDGHIVGQLGPSNTISVNSRRLNQKLHTLPGTWSPVFRSFALAPDILFAWEVTSVAMQYVSLSAQSMATH
jgi:hypothetical protein